MVTLQQNDGDDISVKDDVEGSLKIRISGRKSV